MTVPAPLNDMDINRLVRRILVKHWVDLGRLSVRSTRGHVMLHGRLQRLAGATGFLSGPAVDSMFYELRRQPGVGRVTAHFENWSCDGGLWRPLDEQRDDDRSAPEARIAIEDAGSNAP
jgi:hypothetical protein